MSQTTDRVYNRRSVEYPSEQRAIQDGLYGHVMNNGWTHRPINGKQRANCAELSYWVDLTPRKRNVVHQTSSVQNRVYGTTIVGATRYMNFVTGLFSSNRYW